MSDLHYYLPYKCQILVIVPDSLYCGNKRTRTTVLKVLSYTLEIDNWQIKIKHKEIGYNLKIKVSHWFDTERTVQYRRT